MPDAAPPPRYRAFISYSHADRTAANRLHRRLEAFRVDPDLAALAGTAAASLYPVFLDRAEFTAGDSLRAQTAEALDRSDAMIVLASPDARHSAYVNEEVRLFRHHHPDRPAIPLIVAKPDGLSVDDIFPPALRCRLAPDGSVTGTAEDVLAADWREDGDGPALALAKVIARLLRVPPDEVFRRAERARRRQARLWAAVVAAIVVLVLGGGGASWIAMRTGQSLAVAQQEITDAKALAAQLLSANPARAAEPGQLDSLAKAITAIAQARDTDPRYGQALDLLKAGKTTEAAALLESVATGFEARAAQNNKQAAAAYRQLGAIAGLADPKKAREAYANAARLDPSDIESVAWHAWFAWDAGDLAEADTAYRQVLTLGTAGRDDEWLFWARLGLGDTREARGDLTAARAEYDQGASIADRLARADPGNAGWQRDLSVSYDNVGDVLVAQGNLPEALTSYRDSLAIADRLARADPGNAGWQRDLSVSYEKVGDVLVAQGNLPEALKSYRDEFTIQQKLIERDPSNQFWQGTISVTYEKVGDVLVAQGNLPEALTSYRDSLAIFERLARADPGNAGWQRDLSISLGRVAETLLKLGQTAEARPLAERALAQRRDAIARMPDDPRLSSGLPYYQDLLRRTGGKP